MPPRKTTTTRSGTEKTRVKKTGRYVIRSGGQETTISVTPTASRKPRKMSAETKRGFESLIADLERRAVGDE